MIDLQRPKWQLEIIWLAGQLAQMGTTQKNLPVCQRGQLLIAIHVNNVFSMNIFQ